MKIVQVNLAVPDDIYARLIAGTFEIAAGVVRDNKGIIRKHVPKIANSTKGSEAVTAVANANALQIIKNIKVVGIVVGATVAVGSGIAYLVHHAKKKKAEKNEACVSTFQRALQTYLKAVKAGSINAKVLDGLLTALEEVQSNKAGDSVMLSIPASQLNFLISSIFDYTRRLAEANAVANLHVKAPKRGNKNNLVNLQNYLEIQRQIIEKVA